ncbi:MAG: neutral/alkaline non-lysosomal ceramidase N-terminal domain-containing protein [Gemmataceae bacterium]
MPEVIPPSAHCRLGVARCDITPPVGIYHRMWGAATHDRATGVHQPLTASAVWLEPVEPGQGAKVILAIDHCLSWGPVLDGMLDRLQRETGLPRSAFAVTFSHTHAAGLMDPNRTDLPGGDLIPPYLEALTDSLVRVTKEAHDNLQPAWLTFASGRCTLAGQRDFWDDASKQFVCGFNPDAAADDTVLIGRATSAEGKALAILVNYACHPTTLAFQNTLISPDFPGAMRDLVEKHAGAPCVFLQGASGDLGPREGFVGDPSVAERNGRQLGYAVLAALEALPPPARRFVYQGPVVSGATLGLWDYQPLTAGQIREREAFRWEEETVPLRYRPDLPSLERVRADQESWLEKEKAAAGDESAYRDAHAMVERMRRLDTRLAQLPAGADFPMPVSLGRVGASLWFFVEGEHYQWLQQTLRAAVPDRPLFVVTLTNGWRCSYLPSTAAYGKGIYQETVAVLAQGCLERLAEAAAARLAALSAKV